MCSLVFLVCRVFFGPQSELWQEKEKENGDFIKVFCVMKRRIFLITAFPYSLAWRYLPSYLISSDRLCQFIGDMFGYPDNTLRQTGCLCFLSLLSFSTFSLCIMTASAANHHMMTQGYTTLSLPRTCMACPFHLLYWRMIISIDSSSWETGWSGSLFWNSAGVCAYVPDKQPMNPCYAAWPGLCLSNCASLPRDTFSARGLLHIIPTMRCLLLPGLFPQVVVILVPFYLYFLLHPPFLQVKRRFQEAAGLQQPTSQVFKFILFAAHDTTVMPAAVALEAISPSIPPYAAHLVCVFSFVCLVPRWRVLCVSVCL